MYIRWEVSDFLDLNHTPPLLYSHAALSIENACHKHTRRCYHTNRTVQNTATRRTEFYHDSRANLNSKYTFGIIGGFFPRSQNHPRPSPRTGQLRSKTPARHTINKGHHDTKPYKKHRHKKRNCRWNRRGIYLWRESLFPRSQPDPLSHMPHHPSKPLGMRWSRLLTRRPSRQPPPIP